MTVRDLIKQLTHQEMDNEVTLSLFNSDPVELNNVDDNADGQTVLSFTPPPAHAMTEAG